MKFDDMVVLWEEVVAYKQSIAVDNAVEDAFFLLSSCMGTNIWQRAADQRTLGGNDEARRLPQLLKAQPRQGLNVTVKERGENKEHLDEGTSISHSGKGSGAGKGGGKGAGGGSQTLRQPRDQRNSSASSWRWPRSSLTLLVGGLLLRFLHSCG
ncbi:uncharacterized protein LOC135643183 [Musa acuminata AAA Group]|uniref:uncharacterized protein LOC135643183 n=1 Tax=Musa acuminata AAA Group TaxID=214697 RepID=UPI0031D88F91